MKLHLALLLCALGAATVASADQGITDSTVTFAQVAALAGPASALGTGMNEGIVAAFNEVNAAGGVHGRMLAVDAFDDGYEPKGAVGHFRTLIEGNQHIAFIGPVGTPTTQATQPIAAKAGIPVIGAFTGAGFLRDPALGNVFNVRASYDAETEEWIRLLVDERGMQRIALVYQDDAFGRAGQSGVVAALERRGMTLVAEGTYARNTVAVKAAILTIRKAEADAVLMVGAYRPMAEFIRIARGLDMNPTFVNISFVGTDALVTELGSAGQGVIISQVVPFPWDTDNALVARYQEALRATNPDATPGFVSLEGYITGRLAIAALENAGPDLTREGYLAALQSLGTVNLNGMVMQFGPGDNQGLDDVFMTVISATGEIEELVDVSG